MSSSFCHFVQVTLFGQSAGAQSISLHLTNSKSDKYFQRAIIESSPFTLPYRDHINSALLGDLTVVYLNCLPGDLECLHERSAEEVIAAGTTAGNEIALDVFGPLHLFEPWGPIIDGYEITTNPLNAFRDGTFQRKPLLIGTVTEEGRNYIWQAFPKKPGSSEIIFLLTYLFGIEKALEISEEYNMTDFDDLREPLASIATDYVFACSTFNGSRYISAYNQSQVFHYVYDHAFSFYSVWGPNYTECYGHVCHGSELPILWRTQVLRGYNFTQEEQQLSDAMTNYWSNFAYTGDPNDNSWKMNVSDFNNANDSSWKTKMSNGNSPNENSFKTDMSSDSGPDETGLNKNSKYDEEKVMIWPPYKADSDWQSLLFQSSGNKLLSKFRDKFCRLFDDVGYTTK